MVSSCSVLVLLAMIGITAPTLAAENGAGMPGLPALAALTAITPLTDEELDRVEGQNTSLTTLRLTCPGGPCQVRVGDQVVALPQGSPSVQVSTTQVSTTGVGPHGQTIINEVKTEGQTVIRQVGNAAQPVINQASNAGQIVITPPGNSGRPVTIQASTLALLNRLF